MMRAALLVAMLIGGSAASAQTLREGFPCFNRSVYAVLPVGDKVYVGGAFTRVGDRTGTAVPISPVNGQALAVPLVEGTVFTVVSDSLGGWCYVGGDFSSSSGKDRIGFAAYQDLPVAVDPFPAPAGIALVATPNPAIGATRLTFTLPRDSRVTLRVYDVAGRLVDTPIAGSRPAGRQSVEWSARRAGMYFARLEAAGAITTIKVVRTGS